MTRIEKTVVALIVVWLFQAVLAPFLHTEVVKAMVANATNGRWGSSHSTALDLLSSALGLFAKAVCAYWLYFEGQQEREKTWLWCLFGFFGGIYGVLIFYAVIIVKEIRAKRANQALVPTTPAVTPAADAPVAPAGVAAHL